MLIEIKEIENCRVNVRFEADPSQVDEKRAEVIKYFKNSKVPGFRQGKATPEAVKHHFKQNIEDVLREEMARHAFTTTVAEKNIRPFGQPQFLALNLNGSKFTCDFCVNKIPNVELSQYKGFELPKGSIPNAVEMSEKILQELRTRNGDTMPFDDNDFLQEGDTAIIKYEGFLAGQETPAIANDGELFVVGKAEVAAFNENLLGMKVGEKRQFATMMPENSAVIGIAGKECRFDVELSMASKSNPSPVDDSLAQKVGAKDVNDLIGMVQGIAGKRVQELEKKYLSDQVANRLVAAHELEIPTWLSGFEAQLLAKQYGNNWDDLPDDHKDNFVKFATQNVKLSIILDKVREVEPDAQLSDEEVLHLIKNNVSSYRDKIPALAGQSDEEILNGLVQSGYLTALMSTVRDDFTMDFIIKNSTIVE